AFRLFNERLYDLAFTRFSEFRARYPDHVNSPDALFYEAEALLALGDELGAIERFQDFREFYPTHPLAYEARLALGKHFYEIGDHEQAIEYFSRVLQEAPPAETSAKALYWMGESALALGQDERAIGFFQRAADDYTATATAPTGLYAVAVTEVKRGNYDAAAVAFEQLANRYPGSPYSRNLGIALAEVYYELGDYARTITELQNRIPSLVGEARYRGIFLLAESNNQIRNSAQAIVNYRKLTEDEPDNPYYRQALFGLGWNYYREGAYQWAADEFSKVAVSGDDALTHRAQYYTGVNQKLAGKPLDALVSYRRVVDEWPSSAVADDALFELGLTYYGLRRWEESNEAFSRLLSGYEDSPLVDEALGHYGNTFIALADFDNALNAFEDAIEREAISPEIRNDIVFQKAWLLYRNQRYVEAAPAFLDLYGRDEFQSRADEALFWAAESFFQSGNLGRAQSLFTDYIRTYDSGEHIDAAHYALGWTYFRQSNYGPAITHFDIFLKKYRSEDSFVPYRRDARLRLADSYFALKRYPEAIATYAVLADEEDDYALYQMGQAYSNNGDVFDAITIFRSLLSDYPNSVWREEATYSLGYLYFQNGDYEQAVDTYEGLIRFAPRQPIAAKAQYGIGDALFNAGDMEAAVTAYQEVLETYPNSPFAGDAAASIQFALIALGDEARATAIIDDFAIRHPNSPVVDQLRFKQAEVKFQSGRLDEALTDFQVFLRRARNDDLIPEAYFYLGTILKDRNQNAEAENYLKQIVDRFPESGRASEAAILLGNLQLDGDRYNEALSTFRFAESKADGRQRSVSLARYGQGMALLNVGRVDEARTVFTEAVNASATPSESAPALLGLARLYESENQTADAVQTYREVVNRSQDETGAEALVHLGELLTNQGRAGEALEQLGRIPVLYSGYADWMAEGYLAQVRAHTRLGNRGDATQLCDLVIQQYPDSVYSERASRLKAAL
ncbi:MAG: tetratricopeptide repeat protein, partial [Rhodothermales bacterium]|nr:tetratricopeptide repeat protein [Rhodothermales bacterium]